MPRLEWKIDVSTIITVVGMLSVVLITYGRLDARVAALEEERIELKADLKVLREELVRVRIEVARLRETLDAANHR